MHIERIEPRFLLAAAGPDGYGYVADVHPFEDIVLPSGVGSEFNHPDLGHNTFNFYGTNYTSDQLFTDFSGLIGFGSRVGRDVNGVACPLQQALSNGVARSR